ncbi:MAG: hypothetical protein V4550_18180 [Gemmatimonadota bacterium]
MNHISGCHQYTDGSWVCSALCPHNEAERAAALHARIAELETEQKLLCSIVERQAHERDAAQWQAFAIGIGMVGHLHAQETDVIAYAHDRDEALARAATAECERDIEQSKRETAERRAWSSRHRMEAAERDRDANTDALEKALTYISACFNYEMYAVAAHTLSGQLLGAKQTIEAALVARRAATTPCEHRRIQWTGGNTIGRCLDCDSGEK